MNVIALQTLAIIATVIILINQLLILGMLSAINETLKNMRDILADPFSTRPYERKIHND